jgi:hypothetical protein
MAAGYWLLATETLIGESSHTTLCAYVFNTSINEKINL